MIKKFDYVQWEPNQPQPDIRPVGDCKDRLYMLYEDVVYNFIGVFGKHTGYFQLSIDFGFICDGQSSPRLFWFLFRPDGVVRIGALSHDALYRTKGGKFRSPYVKIFCDGKRCYLGRKACDQIYLYSYLSCGGGEKAEFGYRMLRAFGWYYFGKDTPGK